MKMKKILVVSFIICAVAGVVIMKYSAQTTITQPDEIWVQASTVKETSLPVDIEAIGTLSARSVEITPSVAGHVKKIYFKDGTPVKAGKSLIQLDDAMYQAQYDSVKAKLTYFENDYKRLASLVKSHFISQRDIDRALSDLKEKRAEAEQYDVTLKKMDLLAPFDGVVGKCNVTEGNYVTVGQNLVTLTDTKHLRIEYSVPEKYLPLIKLGQTVKIKSSAYPNKVFLGTVSYVSPTINTDNRSVSLYADMNNEDNLLTSGMFVHVSQSLGNEEHALMIPSRSLVPILDGVQIFKVVNGKAYATTVLTGTRTQEAVQILQGLAKGDVVITDGQLKVRNGMPVQVKSEKS